MKFILSHHPYTILELGYVLVNTLNCRSLEKHLLVALQVELVGKFLVTMRL